MTLYQLEARATGLASGTLITTSPQNAPPINVITRSGTPPTPLQVSTAYPLLGPMSFVSGGGNGSTDFGRHTVGASGVGAGSFVMQVPVLPGTAIDFMRYDNTAAAQTLTLGINGSNQLQLKNSAGTVATYSTALTAGGRYVLYYELIVGTTTSNGTLRIALYDIGETTLLWSFDTGATTNIGTTNISLCRLPGDHASTPVVTVAYNWYRYDNATSTRLAKIDRTLTVSAGANLTVEPWAIIPLDATSTVAALGRASAVWSQVSGPTAVINVPGADATYATVPPSMSQQTLVFRRTVTDYDLPTAKTAYAEVTITVRPAEFGVWVGGTLMPARFEVLV